MPMVFGPFGPRVVGYPTDLLEDMTRGALRQNTHLKIMLLEARDLLKEANRARSLPLTLIHKIADHLDRPIP